MIWILATRGASTRLRLSPYMETPIEGVQSLVYKAGVIPIPATGADPGGGDLGTFTQGLHRVSGYVFSYHGSVAETLFAVTDEIDLIVRYRANGQKRTRTLENALFVGDATVTVPGINKGLPELIGVPFRLQIPEGYTLDDHIVDAVDT